MSAHNRPAILVYSKSGHSLRAATSLAAKTGAELVAVRVTRYRLPGVWVLRAIFDVMRAATPPLSLDMARFAQCPWIVVCGPIWAGQMAPPLRSVLAELAGTAPPVGLLSTSGDHAEPHKAWRVARGVLRRDLAATANIENSIEHDTESERRLNVLAQAMQHSTGQHSRGARGP